MSKVRFPRVFGHHEVFPAESLKGGGAESTWGVFVNKMNEAEAGSAETQAWVEYGDSPNHIAQSWAFAHHELEYGFRYQFRARTFLFKITNSVEGTLPPRVALIS